jgi:hypothetical protein
VFESFKSRRDHRLAGQAPLVRVVLVYPTLPGVTVLTAEVRLRTTTDAEGTTSATRATQTKMLASAAALRQLRPFEGDLVYGHLPPIAPRLRNPNDAGGDSIADVDVLRAGAGGELFDQGRAPSTIGTWLRGFIWASVRMLDKVSRQVLARAWQAGLGPELTSDLTVDFNSTICQVYGTGRHALTAGRHNHVLPRFGPQLPRPRHRGVQA